MKDLNEKRKIIFVFINKYRRPKDNGVLAFDYMRKGGINVGRNDIWHYTVWILNHHLKLILPLFYWYCRNIKFKIKYLDKFFWRKAK